MSIVQSLIEQVETEIINSGHSGRVQSLDLVIGRLSGVHVDSIRFAFELLAPGTIVAGAELRIDEPKAQILCRDCQAQTSIDEMTMHCPDCGSDDIHVTGGQDLLLQSIELEEEGAES